MAKTELTENYIAIMRDVMTMTKGQPRSVFGFPLGEVEEQHQFYEMMLKREDVNTVRKYFSLKYGHCVIVEWKGGKNVS